MREMMTMEEVEAYTRPAVFAMDELQAQIIRELSDKEVIVTKSHKAKLILILINHLEKDDNPFRQLYHARSLRLPFGSDQLDYFMSKISVDLELKKALSNKLAAHLHYNDRRTMKYDVGKSYDNIIVGESIYINGHIHDSEKSWYIISSCDRSIYRPQCWQHGHVGCDVYMSNYYILDKNAVERKIQLPTDKFLRNE